MDNRYEGRVTVINDEELRQFHDWLEAKGDPPSVVLTLRWIAEFEVYAEEDEEDYRWANALVWLRAPYDPPVRCGAGGLRFGRREEKPHTRLKRFHDWLRAKGDDPTAVLARRWVTQFEETKEMKIENDVKVTEPGGNSIIPTMHAGKAHVKWMVSSYRPELR